MMLCDLLTGEARFDARFQALPVSGISADSRAIKPGFLFAALAGSKTDGAKFIMDAVARGAVAVLGAPEVAAQVNQLGVEFIPAANPRFA